MKAIFFFLLALNTHANATTNTTVSCSYKFMGMDFSQVAVSINENGEPDSSVLVTTQGRSHKESATPEIIAADELIHLWISKESPDNSIEMIVYREKRKFGQSKLINHHMPVGKEIWGDCTAQPNDQ